MACEQWRGKLDLYLDGELVEADATALAVHLRGCIECTGKILERVQLKRAVHSAGKRYEPSAQLRSQITRSVVTRPRLALGWRWKLAGALALVVIVLAGTFYRSSEQASEERARVYSELTDLHVATLASASPVDVLSTDRHTVKPWFQGRIPFTFNLPELQGSQFALLGGRVAYLQQSAGAHLIYQVRQHKISVFIFSRRGTEALKLPSGLENEASFNIESWSQNDLRYFVIGDAGSEDIAALSKLLRAAG
jgi:anti-sigma factor RsiW